MKWLDNLARRFSRVLCRMGFHTVYREEGASTSTVGIKGGTMTDHVTWSVVKCTVCGRNLKR